MGNGYSEGVYATSIDYDPNAEISIRFFKKVQNKIHYAVHGQTVAEVILTMSGEQLLIGNGSVSHKEAIDKASGEYRKYKARTLSEVERDYMDAIKLLEQKTDKK